MNRCAYCNLLIPPPLRVRGTCASCANIERDRTKRKILIIGLPRSGTTFVSRVLSRYLRIGHEQVDTHGTSSWMFAVDDPESYSFGHKDERRSDYDWGLIVHLVREPLACIGSLTTMHPEFFAAVEKHCGKIEFDIFTEGCAGTWVAWNRLIEPQAHVRIRVEDISTDGLGKKVNTRKHGKVTWEQLGRYEKDVREMAARYGYHG